jgi:hypothetical protein
MCIKNAGGRFDLYLMKYSSDCWKNGARAQENEWGVYCGLGEGCGQTREGARAVNTCTIYWKMAAQMEGIIV